MNTDHLSAIIQAGCFFWPLLTQVSTLTSAAISVDRLLALSLRLRYRHAVSLRRVRAVIVSFWLISSLTAAALKFAVHKTVGFIASVLIYVLILVSLVFSISSYTKIFLNLNHQQAQIQEHVQTGQPNGGSLLNIARYKKTVSSIAWIQLTLFVCYAPYFIVGIIVGYGKNTLFDSNNRRVTLIRYSRLFKLFPKSNTLLLEDSRCEARSEEYDPSGLVLV